MRAAGRSAFAVLRAPLAALAGQRDRVVLLAPVAFGGGMAAWFGGLRLGATTLWACAAAFAVAAIVARLWPAGVRARFAAARWGAGLVCAALALAMAGGALAAMRIQARAAPRLARATDAVAVTGWVEAVLPGQRGPRFLVRVAEIEGGVRLTRVQIAAPGGPGAGQAIRCVAILRPPAPPLAPQAFDPQFRAYVDQVGAVGFGLGRCRPIVLPAPPDAATRRMLALAAYRRDLAETVADAAPGRGGGIAAALIAGDASFVDPDSATALRDSGLAHLISVSGLHMSLVAGMTFAAVTLGVALVGPLALRVPARKIGAAAALAASGAYLVISGSSVPAERAFVMTAVAFGAVLLDRPAITMRGLALAAMVVLAHRPESVLDPGFQMSFAATGALVAWYEAARLQPPQAASTLLVVRVVDAVRGIVAADLVTTLVAGAATDPFVLFHFGRFTTYAALANLVSGPIVAFVVAPAAGLAALAAPFGLAEGPLHVMAAGLDLVVAIGAGFAARPEAVVPIAPPPPLAFGCAILALVWAITWRGAARHIAVAPAIAAAALTLAASRPVLLVREDARLVLAHVGPMGGGGGWRLIAPSRGGAFARDRFASLAGVDPRKTAAAPAPDGCARGTPCLWWTPGGARIAWAPDADQVLRLCREADLVIAPAPERRAPRTRDAPTPGGDGPSPRGGHAEARRAPSTAPTVDAPRAPEAPPASCRAKMISPATDGRGGYAVYDGQPLIVRRGRALRDVTAPWARPGAAEPTEADPVARARGNGG
ncbi:MAG: ComEC/Rec2 family competence protein [Alphaproteobacteria bacterium]|nr:ComEC/Rec2 family competence protein [Alphaproteobacteria bacterium]